MTALNRFKSIWTSLKNGHSAVEYTEDPPCYKTDCNNESWIPWLCKPQCEDDLLTCTTDCVEESCKSQCVREFDQCVARCY